MKNLVLDVSNIEKIEIETKNNTMTIHLDRTPKLKNIIHNANTVEILVSIITLVGKIFNLN